MKTYSILRWEDPPDPDKGNGAVRPSPYGGVITTLKKNAGKWAVVAEKKTQVSAWNLCRALKNHPGLEVLVRNKLTVYARWAE